MCNCRFTMVCVFFRSHLLSVPPGQGLAEALATSVLFHTEDGPPVVAAGGSDPFGMDHYEDPELAMVRLTSSFCETFTPVSNFSVGTESFHGRTAGTRKRPDGRHS